MTISLKRFQSLSKIQTLRVFFCVKLKKCPILKIKTHFLVLQLGELLLIVSKFSERKYLPNYTICCLQILQ